MHRAWLLEGGTEEWADAMDKVVIAIMIEKKQALDNLDAMLEVPGVDMVQFGPADYSNSIGLTGQFTHPQVKDAEQFVIFQTKQQLEHPNLVTDNLSTRDFFVVCLANFIGNASVG